MKLTLGTTVLADVPDDIARRLLQLFAEPGHLDRGVEVTPREPQPYVSPLEDSRFAQLGATQVFDVRLNIRATIDAPGHLRDMRDLLRL